MESRTSKGRGFGFETRSKGQLEADPGSDRHLVSNQLQVFIKVNWHKYHSFLPATM